MTAKTEDRRGPRAGPAVERRTPRRRSWRRTARIVLLALSVLGSGVLGLAWLAGHLATTALPPWMIGVARTDNQTVHIRLAGRDYWVPVNYLDSMPRRNSTGEHEALLLEALLPNLDPRTTENREEFRVPGWGRKVVILIIPIGDSESAMTEHHRIRVESYGPMEPRGHLHDLRFSARGGANPYSNYHELYEDFDEDHLRTYIFCIPEGDAPSPACSQWFMLENLEITVSYHRRYLSDWQHIQHFVSALIESWQQPPTGR